jgi:uncharacterized membrane protein
MNIFFKTHGLKLALAASLTLNILAAGYAVGQFGGPSLLPHERVAKHTSHQKMDPEVHQKIMGLMEQNKSQIMAARDAYKTSQSKVRALLKASDVDVTQLSVALNEVRMRLTDVQTVLHTMLVQAVPTLTAEERLALIHKQGRIMKMIESMHKHPKKCREKPAQVE